MIARVLTNTNIISVNDIIRYLEEPVVEFLEFLETRTRGPIEVLLANEDGSSVEKLVLEVHDDEPEVMPVSDLLLAVLRDQQGRVWTLEVQGWNYPADELEKMKLKEMIAREGFTLSLCSREECSPLFP